MESVRVERFDHVGVMAEVRKDLGLMAMIDARLVPDEQEGRTPGEARAGMILNGWGFANRPVALTPQCFANTPLGLLCREGVHAEMVNRFKLGRTLAEVYTDGGDLVWSEMALAVCAQEGIDWRCNHLATSSVSLTGEYVPDPAAQAMVITHGDAKDHRPDLKQAILELMVSPDGGVPFGSQSWDGHTSDTKMFQARAQALRATFKTASSPRYLVADSKLDHEAKAANLHSLGLITRLPNTLTVVSQVITDGLSRDTWPRVHDTTRYQRVELCHDGMAQRWLVVSSEAALQRAEATVSKAQQREYEAIEKHRFHWPAQRCETPEAAQAALGARATSWTYHQVASSSLIAHQR